MLKNTLIHKLDFDKTIEIGLPMYSTEPLPSTPRKSLSSNSNNALPKPLEIGGSVPDRLQDDSLQISERYGSIIERIDFSGHNGKEPHVNYNLMDKKTDKNKKSNIGQCHEISLFDRSKDKPHKYPNVLGLKR